MPNGFAIHSNQSSRRTFDGLMAKMTGRCKDHRKLGNNTYLFRREDGSLAVKLHKTDIITYYADGRIRLNTGNWKTVTTKARMNEYLDGWGISQDRSIWYILRERPEKDKDTLGWWEQVAVFEDQCILHPDGTVTGAKPLAYAKKKLKDMKAVRQYVNDYMDALFNGKVPKPGGGDCWFCLMRDAKTGRMVQSKDHIEAHVRDRYYVSSLIVAATELYPSWAANNVFAIVWGGAQVSDEERRHCMSEGARHQLGTSLKRFIYHSLGYADCGGRG